jgi:formylmethanofuran dehydrogenase subunit C
MATKTFKIGEYSLHGQWTITIKGGEVTVEGKSWIGMFMEGRVFKVNDRLRRDLDDYLNQKMTSYWAGQLIDWIAEHVEMPEHSYVVAPW